MQIQGSRKAHLYTGSVDAGIKIYKRYGLKAVQKGWTATCVRDIFFCGCFFFYYDVISEAFNNTAPNAPPTVKQFFAGGLTGLLTWFCIFPSDSLKSIAQTEALAVDKRIYKGYFHMCRTYIGQNGFLKLYNGLFVCMLRAFPVNAVTFVFYEEAKKGVEHLRKK
jgi:solute carrier family 25 carnitine/acylcarnitine transporter 20/29